MCAAKLINASAVLQSCQDFYDIYALHNFEAGNALVPESVFGVFDARPTWLDVYLQLAHSFTVHHSVSSHNLRPPLPNLSRAVSRLPSFAWSQPGRLGRHPPSNMSTTMSMRTQQGYPGSKMASHYSGYVTPPTATVDDLLEIAHSLVSDTDNNPAMHTYEEFVQIIRSWCVIQPYE